MSAREAPTFIARSLPIHGRQYSNASLASVPQTEHQHSTVIWRSSNIDGFDNTANGDNALFSNTGGAQNTANGVFALYNNTTGYNNTADGSFALLSNTTGNYNTATGDFALLNNTTGNNNAALGLNASIAHNATTLGLGKNAGSTYQCTQYALGNVVCGVNKIRSSPMHAQTPFRGINGVAVPERRGNCRCQRSPWHGNVIEAFQGCDQTHGQGERSDPRAATGDFPLQA